MDKVKGIVNSLTDIGMALLSLGIVASVLIGGENLPFVGNVIGNITGIISTLGSAGLAGLLSLGIVVWLVQNR